MLNLFVKIYDFLNGKKALIALLISVMFIVFGYFAFKIELKEDISDFLPKTPENEKINYLYNNIAIADKIVVKISAVDTTADQESKGLILMDAADKFVSFIDSAANENYVKNIQYQVDQQAIIDMTRFLTLNMPYFMRDEDYVRMDSIIASNSVQATLEHDKELILSPIGMGVKENIMLDPLHLSGPILKRLQLFQVSDNYQVTDGYIFTKDGNSIMVFIDSANPVSETKKNSYLAQCVENAVKAMPTEVKTDYFGGNIVAVTNSDQIKKDSLYSMAIAVFLIVCLLFYFFRNIRALSIIILSVLFGGIVSIAAMYFIQGSMSAIALGAASIIFGISVDYVMPLLIYKTQAQDSKQALKTVFLPLLISNLTTVGAFLSLLFLRAGSMRDFGIMASIALIATLLFVLVFVPHLCSKIYGRPWQFNLADKLGRFEPDGNKAVVSILFIITIVMCFFASNVKFESDMQKINYMTDSQRKQFKELSNVTPLGKTSVYYVSDGKTLNDALKAHERRMPLLDSVIRGKEIKKIGIGDLLPSDSMQVIRLNKWNSFWSTRGDILKEQIKSASAKSGFKQGTFDRFFSVIESTHAVQPLSFFQPVREALLKEYIIEKDERAMVVNLLYVAPEAAAGVESQLSKGSDGFVFDSGSMIRSMVTLLSEDFNFVLFICMGVVFISLILAFGRIELSLMAFMPMIVSWFWILGIMGITGIRFNIVNIVLATFIFGLGNDYDVFITNGLMYKYGYGRRSLNAFKVSILLSALTMIIGIGVLAFAKHPAMRSLGQVTVIGMISVVFAAYIITPLLFKFLVYTKGEKRLVPITLKNFSLTVYCFIYFLLGSLFLTIAGFLTLKCIKPTEKRKLRFHRMILKFCAFAARYIPGVKYRLTGEKEDFIKPAIIVFNHQSHLDLMYVLQFSPKIVILTNDWVWNSPFYGKLIKYAEFYPITNGIENCLEHLRGFVERGYSIAVFPEGTRSEDGSVKRFHRGAFYLAEKLKLDILPIIFHGVGDVLPKRELILRNGAITAKILPRISPEDTSFGADYVSRTKQIRHLFIKEYALLSRNCEDINYYKYLILHNYIYKGPKIERLAKQNFKMCEKLSDKIKQIPANSSVVIENCGIGIVALTAALVRKDVSFIATDSDPENIALASNCAAVPANLKYMESQKFVGSASDIHINLSNK